jgi:glutamine synthetase
MSDPKTIINTIKEKEIQFVDLRFTDPRGKMQHLSQHVSTIDEKSLVEGFMFDGSSIAGWKAINESDMKLMPDCSRAIVDPFFSQPTLSIFCDILDPISGKPYERDPRSTAKQALAYMDSIGVGDTAYFGPEPEFFVFDDVKFEAEMNSCFYKLDSSEGPYNSGSKFEEGNMGHRPGIKGGYFPVPPVDSAQDLRSEMVLSLVDMGVPMEKHHHEVAPSQHELGMMFGTLIETADNVQLYKYAVQNVAHSFGQTATFMPKPVAGDNGTGMHTHQSIWKDGKPLFAGDKYAQLSETCLYYIGGIIKHAKALNAFTNPSTNSYKRFPDATANPYLAFSAMLMAGLDGIQNKIDPGDAMDQDLYELPASELASIPTVCGSLREALDALSNDMSFLTKGGVFTEDQIEAYIDLKMEEVVQFEHAPHPIEFKMYYSS